MFVDLVGSTALASRLDPEEMAKLLRAYQGAVAGAIARFEGHVAKYMGDGILAYFGYPQAHEDEAERAVRAGLAAVAAVHSLESAPNGTLAARVGIATGPVVVGELIGEGAAREETVVGDTPNLAARLQAAARPGHVLISQETRRLLGNLFALADPRDLALKGFDGLVRAYTVLGASEADSRFGALRGSTPTPLVGRERELIMLAEAWDSARRGQGRVVLLGGEPGVGKSRLIQTLRSKLPDQLNSSIEFQCSPLHAQSALHPFAVEIERAAEFARDDDAKTRQRKLGALLAKRMDDSAAAAPVLERLLGLSGDGRLSPDLTPQQLRAKTLAVMVAQLEGLVRRRRWLLLAFEDAHWADPTSLDLLATVVERAAELPILAVVSHRPEFSPRWGDLAHVVPISLHRLNRFEAAALVEHVAGPGRLALSGVDQIVTRADGVPLFIEELAKVAVQAAPQGASGDQTVPLPSTLHDLLLARLNGLGPDVKQTLQTAAAVGREFHRELVGAVSQRDGRLLDEALDRAATSGLIVREGAGGGPAYRFRHALIQEAAYSSMLKSRRRSLHARIARAAEELEPELRNAQPEWLARHYAAAGDIDRAAALWLAAGRRAKAAFATREAVAHLRSCLEVLQDVEGKAGGQPLHFGRHRAEALTMLGDLSGLSEDLAAAERYYGKAIEVADADLRRRIENKRHRRGTVLRGGARVAFYEHGSGDATLLFVSAQALGVATFQPVVERLCDEFRIVTIDPRGSGGSDPLVRPYRLIDHAADVRAVSAALGATPRLVGVGLSMGANILFRVAQVAPKLLSGIVTVGAPTVGHRRPFFPEDYMELLEATERTGEVEPMLRLHVRRVFSEPEMQEMLETIVRSRLKLPRETLLSFFLDGREGDVTDILPMIETPTLVTHGRDDRLVTYAAAELMASLLPNAALYPFNAKGHLPIFTATDEFCDVLRAFVVARLQSDSGRRRSLVIRTRRARRRERQRVRRSSS